MLITTRPATVEETCSIKVSSHEHSLVLAAQDLSFVGSRHDPVCHHQWRRISCSEGLHGQTE
jgi:hypothetical protein